MLRKIVFASSAAGVAAVGLSHYNKVNCDVKIVRNDDSDDDKKGYQRKFKVIHNVEEIRREKAARIPDSDSDNARLAKRVSSLGYVSSLANMLMDVSRSVDSSPFMDMAIEEACEGIIKGEGGPFGAVIVQGDKVVARAHNCVLQTNDPTAHAEVTAIRKACARLGRFDLSDCVLYTSCEPCAMCFGAVHWAKIGIVKYAATTADAAKAGFDDQFIYDSLNNEAEECHCQFIHEPHAGAVDVFQANYSLY